MMKPTLRNLSLTGLAGLAAGALLYIVASQAATITTMPALPDGAGAFTVNNLIQSNANWVLANTNFANINTQLATLAGQTATVVPVSSFADCATTAACPSTVRGTLRTVIGIGLLATGSPSTYAVTTISPAFTSATSYLCTAQDATTIATNIGVLTAGYVSGSAVTFTGPNTTTDTFRFICTGY